MVDSVLQKLRDHMDREALGSPLNPQRSVKQTMDAITAKQGNFLIGEIKASMDEISQEIQNVQERCFATTQ